MLSSDLPSGSADFVISTFGLKTFNPEQHARLAALIARVLKPGCVFSMIEASDPKGWWLRPLYNVARLIEEGRMTEHGLREVDVAKADGRWARAYNSKDMKIPDDLQAAIDAEPKARAMLAKLSSQNRFALAFRTHNMKTEAGRTKEIAALVAMLKRGETIYPQGKK